jgi:hypothetical protein
MNVLPFTQVAEDDDGGVTISFGHVEPSYERELGEHDENLVDHIEAFDLSQIVYDVLAGIEEDERSRQEWISSQAKALDILGLKLEAPRSDLGSSAAPMEGMSNVRHPLLLEATLRFQANAVGELLPSDGPVKVANSDGEELTEGDEQAERLEKSMNTYVTSTATEYYPDTDRMLYSVGLRGCGFKKGFHCPLRRRPVIESVDAKDLIVSNNATDLYNATRVTQVIRMNRTTLKRMQIVGAYADVDISYPNQSFNRLDAKEKRIQGIEINTQRVEDTEYTLYECYCDLDIPGFEHKLNGKITGLPIPYKVTIDKTSRQVLEIRRNWVEGDDDLPMKRKTFVMYPFVPMFGFYPMGLLNILGNTTNAVTAAWRVLLDAGMFGNFPGFLYAKNGARQTKNNFRVAPGSGSPIEVAAGADIRQAVMPLPYQRPDPASMQLAENIAQTGQRVGGTAETNVGEGRQDAPVGTTLALIEQAAKIIDAVHKRIHAAQAEEFALLRDLLKEDPEALWRHNKKAKPWDVDELLAALNNYDLVPKADPNTPSHMHRIMKAQLVKQLAQANPAAYDMKEVDTHCLRAAKVGDPQRFFAKTPPPGMMAPPAPDPALIVAQGKLKADEMSNQAKMQANQLKLVDIQQRAKDKQLDRESKMELEKMLLMERLAVHPAAAPLISESGI